MEIKFDSKALVIMIIIPIVISVFSTVKMVNALVTVSKYEKVQGTVVEVAQREVSSAEKSVTAVFIKYNYEINGKIYQTESRSGVFISKKIGSNRKFYVNPKNPSEIIFKRNIIGYGITIVIGVVIAFAFVCIKRKTNE